MLIRLNKVKKENNLSGGGGGRPPGFYFISFKTWS